MKFLFSFSGRIRRVDYWAFIIPIVIISVALLFLISLALGIDWIDLPTYLTPGKLSHSRIGEKLNAAFIFIGLIVLWPETAITVKRLHDRNKTGWWTLLFTIMPMVIPIYQHYGTDPFNGSEPLRRSVDVFTSLVSLWALIEFGFLRGTKGENQYGPDPLPPDAYVKPEGLA